MLKKIFATLLALCICLTIPLGVRAEEETEEPGALPDSPQWIAAMGDEREVKQLFVVAGIGQTTAYVSLHEKDENGVWKELMSTPAFMGKNGLGKTVEGDGMTPVGEFFFNAAFGIAEDPGCAIPYQQVTEDDYWSGDIRDGYFYNQMVNVHELTGLNTEDSEHIVDYPYQYQYCLSISYNEECIPGLGSAIFLHCLGPCKPYTGGCVAIPEEQMVTVMTLVDPDCMVIIDSLQVLSPETWAEWGL